MTREDKELLLKDLCVRLPYKVKCCIYNFGKDTVRIKEDVLWSVQGDNILTLKSCVEKGEAYMYHQIKPYLFPLSSMTREQLFDVQEILGKNEIEIKDGFLHIVDSDRNTISYLEILALLEWFYKNHFDINNLIPAGLAIDATNLNIY